MGNACLKELMVLIDHDVKGSIHILLERIYFYTGGHHESLFSLNRCDNGSPVLLTKSFMVKKLSCQQFRD